jgi:hypothetical protein
MKRTVGLVALLIVLFASCEAIAVVWQSNEEIRDMMVRYYTERKELPATPDGNWKLLPEAARKTLVKEALAAAGREEFN